MTFQIGEIVFFYGTDRPAKVVACNAQRTEFALDVPFSQKRLARVWELRPMRRDMDIKVEWSPWA